jgi:hypothetical protein
MLVCELIANMLLLAGMLLEFFIASIVVTYSYQTKWLFGDQLSIGSISKMSSRFECFVIPQMLLNALSFPCPI